MEVVQQQYSFGSVNIRYVHVVKFLAREQLILVVFGFDSNSTVLFLCTMEENGPLTVKKKKKKQ